MLEFETESLGTISDPSSADINSGLSDLDGDSNGFAILRRGEIEYIQAAGSSRAGLKVEYHDPETDDHFAAPNPVSLEEAKELFEDYRRGGTQWATKVAWRKMDIPSQNKKGCAGPAMLLIAIGAAGIGEVIHLLV